MMKGYLLLAHKKPPLSTKARPIRLAWRHMAMWILKEGYKYTVISIWELTAE